ncbi:MAG: dTDP-4-dehydrorhamnose reductase [Anaerolineales bacterium]|nr:dTDP-4-dehydrorhamnose reductase [Anaerolineales bacterium]
MNILLLGNTGQLGWELERTLSPLGKLHALDYPQIDFSDTDRLITVVRQVKPGLIINATAYTAVDQAERESALAAAINAIGPARLAEEAVSLGAAFIHYSTDFVFDGAKQQPYTESDPANPLGVYGQTKLDGEIAIQQAGGAYLILRTSWVYSLRRPSFVTRMLEWSHKQPTIRLVSDQVRSPTWCRALAEITSQALSQGCSSPHGSKCLTPWLAERSGLYHLAGSGAASMLEWGQVVLELDPKREEQVVTEMIPALTAEFPTPARRPLYSVLDCTSFEQTFNLRLPDWREALRLALDKT